LCNITGVLNGYNSIPFEKEHFTAERGTQEGHMAKKETTTFDNMASYANKLGPSNALVPYAHVFAH